MPKSVALCIDDIAAVLAEERAEQLGRDPVPCYLAVIGLVYEFECPTGSLALKPLRVGHSDPSTDVMPAEERHFPCVDAC